MAGGAPGSSSRGRGGKFKKFTRGGGKHFSRDLRPLDADGNEIDMWSPEAQKNKKAGASDEESEEDSDEESSDEESDDDDGAAGPSTQTQSAAELSREERRKEKKARKEAAIARAKKPVQVGDLPPSDSEDDDDDDDDAPMPANPNHSRQARNQTKPAAASVDEAAEGVQKLSVAPSRREREAVEAQAAKERYRKLHEAGKTDEAKADLARLKLIREKREAEAARKQAEKEEKEAQDKAKRAEIEAREAKRREAAMGPKKGPKKK
ncbi:hypothetical protein N658DRAFT_499812 [Parathielavia hyrcaniae]|uniref:Casein kinase substrate phosphoprotein PP28 domain-containing protein n=1 Tax=Parathielavia hyrcaniae TaxID=113614 RepID=A0AAN6PUD6_9PEZI|nr:hypothetical protein N658DRAFT_499812 [Parathielavia hyrcaniae]